MMGFTGGIRKIATGKEYQTVRWLFMAGFVYAFIFGQGLPLWDDDFTSWFWKIKDRGIGSIFLEWISPISTQPQYWGFNERPVQALVYKIFHLVSGYEAWSYFLYKDVIYAGMGVMVYLWGLRLAGNAPHAKLVALAAAAIFLLAPGTMASHVIHSDLATTAEFLFLLMTYIIWGEIEKTPQDWAGLPDPKNPVHRKWMLRWAAIAFCTYLGYKSKADLKLIPGIMGAYVFLVRRRQLGFFAVPLALMVLLAVPWGPGIFSKLPPFLPGSKGSEIGWMWQPASMDRFLEFIWASAPYDFVASLSSPTLSLAGILGPFLLVGIMAFLGWKMEAFDRVPWARFSETPVDRARTFALIWFGVILVGISALPAINYIFRVRYGIITMVPVSLLLAWVFGLFSHSVKQLPRWAVATACALLAIQSGINLSRSIDYRRSMGQVMVSVDQVYEEVRKNHQNSKLTLFPDFRPYDYRPDSGQVFLDKTWLSAPEDLRKHEPFRTYAISWSPSLWPEVEVVKNFSGCREGVLFDAIFSCPPATGTYLLRYIGQDPLYSQAEEARSRGDIAEARKLHEQFLAKYPGSLAGQFVMGLVAFQQQDWTRAHHAYATLEKYYPYHLSILYNHALVLRELNQFDGAIERFKFVVGQDGMNYAALINLYHTYTRAGLTSPAKKLLAEIHRKFPQDGEVNRLIASEQK